MISMTKYSGYVVPSILKKSTHLTLFLYSDKNGIRIDSNGVYMLVDATGITELHNNKKFDMIKP